MFYQRFIQLCESRKIKPSPVVKQLGLSSGSPTAWKNGTIPDREAFVKIADYFDCSVDYLLGRTDNLQAHKAQSNNTVNGNYNAVGNANTVTVGSQPLDNHQKLLIERYNKLPPEIQIDIIQILGDEKKIAALLDGLK